MLAVAWLRAHHEQAGAGAGWSDMAVFYRINALSRVVEDALLRSSIPYQVARGTAFYDRKEVRDAIAYLRVLANPSDEIALLRIINTPTRGIGNTTIERLRAHAAANGITLGEALERAGQVPAINRRAVAAIGRFGAMLNGWRQKMTRAQTVEMFEPGIRDLVELIIKDSGLEQHYQKEDEDKAANLYELVTAAQRFDEEYGEPEADLPRRLADYLESVALVSDVDAIHSEAGAVTLMTLHAAKGLEFPIVAMIGLEEGLMPHSRSMDSPAEFEEERRLCFVGITRAQQHLMLSHARYRTIRGLRERTIPSPFLRELPDDVLHIEDLSGTASVWDDDDGAGFDDFEPRRRSSPFPVPGSKGARGTRVNHPQFGPGSVLAVTGRGGNARAKVQFDRAGVKTLILEYARLEVIE
jgi:DNA helicase-2/ATP-dependent DNA helicase PcrA